MITRAWRGWTAADDAPAYESYLLETLFPSLTEIPGFVGADVLRRPLDSEEEFLTLVHFESLDAVKGFAGATYETPVIGKRAAELLIRMDDHARHYNVSRFVPHVDRAGDDPS